MLRINFRPWPWYELTEGIYASSLHSLHFQYPRGVCTCVTGALYVLDTGNKRLCKMNISHTNSNSQSDSSVGQAVPAAASACSKKRRVVAAEWVLHDEAPSGGYWQDRIGRGDARRRVRAVRQRSVEVAEILEKLGVAEASVLALRKGKAVPEIGYTQHEYIACRKCRAVAAGVAAAEAEKLRHAVSCKHCGKAAPSGRSQGPRDRVQEVVNGLFCCSATRPHKTGCPFHPRRYASAGGGAVLVTGLPSSPPGGRCKQPDLVLMDASCGESMASLEEMCVVCGSVSCTHGCLELVAVPVASQEDRIERKKNRAWRAGKRYVSTSAASGHGNHTPGPRAGRPPGSSTLAGRDALTEGDICEVVGVSSMREQMSASAKQVAQVQAGDELEILKKGRNHMWFFVRNAWQDKGWVAAMDEGRAVLQKSVEPRPYKQKMGLPAEYDVLSSTQLLREPETGARVIVSLEAGDRVLVTGQKDGCWAFAEALLSADDDRERKVDGWCYGLDCDGDPTIELYRGAWRLKTGMFVELCGGGMVPLRQCPDHWSPILKHVPGHGYRVVRVLEVQGLRHNFARVEDADGGSGWISCFEIIDTCVFPKLQPCETQLRWACRAGRVDVVEAHCGAPEQFSPGDEGFGLYGDSTLGVTASGDASVDGSDHEELQHVVETVACVSPCNACANRKGYHYRPRHGGHTWQAGCKYVGKEPQPQESSGLRRSSRLARQRM